MSLVNVNASHNSGFGFSSTVDPRSVNPAALSVPTSNIQAAAASKIVGGARINRRKINKISRKYKMRGSRKHVRRSVRRMKSRVRSRCARRGRSGRSRSGRRSHSRSRSLKQKGGYAQFYNNMPNTPSFSTGGVLSPSLSALANPVPYQVLSNNTSCVDNYRHDLNSGFPSKN
jgi:hypothetical protein